MRRMLATAGAAALVAAAPAAAAYWDADSDGFVDRGEFEAAYDDQGLFETFDVDGDGGIDGPELAGVRYATMDLDGDGQVGVSEWNEWIDRRSGESAVSRSVDAWDADGDGVISRAEYDAEVERRGMFADVAGGDDGVFDEGEFRTGLFDDLDADGDGRLGEDEAPSGSGLFRARAARP